LKKLNEKRQDYEIDPKYKQVPLVKSKTTNSFKKTGTLKKVDEKHFGEKNRGRKIVHYKSKFKKKKKINKSKYDDNSRQTEGNERSQEQLGENNNFLYNISICNSMTIGQSIEINPIKAQNGYLVLKTGSIEIPTNYEYHYLSVNITKTEQTFEDLLKEADEFNDVIQIRYLVEKLKREINGITISKRSKRGLFNIVSIRNLRSR